MMFNLKFDSFKSGFFDRKAVMGAVAKGERKALSKIGAFIRTRARSLIRKRKRVSNPGEPPSAHQGKKQLGNDGIRAIFFAWDSSKRSVVIGPVKFNGHSSTEAPNGVPALLEVGGTATRTRKTKNGTTSKQLTYHARPFMEPAFKSETTNPKLNDAIANFV